MKYTSRDGVQLMEENRSKSVLELYYMYYNCTTNVLQFCDSVNAQESVYIDLQIGTTLNFFFPVENFSFSLPKPQHSIHPSCCLPESQRLQEGPQCLQKETPKANPLQTETPKSNPPSQELPYQSSRRSPTTGGSQRSANAERVPSTELPGPAVT